jgi:hypothetical protein
MAIRCSKGLVLILCILISISTALPGSSGKGKGKGKGNRQSAKNSEEIGIQVTGNIFRESDRKLIVNHFRNNQEALPPGLAKRDGDLPPGLEKQLKRNGHLPPGLEKKLNPFPVELERNLPPLKEGLRRGIIGGMAVILDKKTSIILDTFSITF